ncbi:MAG: amidohydrolase family protein [Oscillospiraceae bacterium]|jgi:predicted TIM-barrel fold metal-dependent hydrolase
MRIDFENHFYSERFLEVVKSRTEIPYMEPDTLTIHHGGGSCSLPIKPIVPALVDLGEQRISEMDKCGVDVAIVSSSLGIEQLPAGLALEAAKESNDTLYMGICKYPERLRGYAILSVDDIGDSVKELERCSKDLGFVGWNAFSNYDGEMLDSPRFFPLLRKAAELDMLVYIHPCFPAIPALHEYGPAMAAAGFGFAVDVSTCLLRMIFAGIFDALPNLKVMIGHLGEGLPFSLDRLDSQAARTNRNSAAVNKELPSYYFRHNIWVSTSGNFSSAAFKCAKDVLGIDRIVMGTDYPMESLERSAEFVDTLELSKGDREKIMFRNGMRDFKLNLK